MSATTYGTIPSSTPAADSPVGFISGAEDRGGASLATRRPWGELVHRRAFTLPPTLGETYLRVRTNVSYFAMNYAVVVLLILFLSLLWHPISLIVFIAMMAAWLFLYFLRDEPLVILRREIGDKAVLIVLSVVTVGVLLFTDAKLNILLSLLVGVLAVLGHAAVRRTDDLFLKEEAAGPGGWYSASWSA